jgi:hypothetical protein
LRYRICLNGLRRSTNNLNQNSQSSDGHMEPGSSDYDAGILSARPRHAVTYMTYHDVTIYLPSLSKTSEAGGDSMIFLTTFRFMPYYLTYSSLPKNPNLKLNLFHYTPRRRLGERTCSSYSFSISALDGGE